MSNKIITKFLGHPEPAYAEAMLWLRAGRLDSGSRTAMSVGSAYRKEQRHLAVLDPGSWSGMTKVHLFYNLDSSMC